MSFLLALVLCKGVGTSLTKGNVVLTETKPKASFACYQLGEVFSVLPLAQSFLRGTVGTSAENSMGTTQPTPCARKPQKASQLYLSGARYK